MRALACVLLAACASTPHPSLYERVAARVKRDPQALTPAPAPAGDREKIAKLVGKWRCPSHVFGTPTTPEREGREPQRVHFDVDKDGDLMRVDDATPTPWRSVEIAWDGRARAWVRPIAEGDAFGVQTASAWSGDELVFDGQATIVGEPTALRSTFRLVDRDHYELLNEELGLANKPVPLDVYRCAREP
jgi:hypothetical protein